MNYKSLINKIKGMSLNHSLVCSFEYGNNVYEANFVDNKYPLLYLMYQPHNINNPSQKFNFIFYYIDRLLPDKSNELDIHESGLKAINDILLQSDLDFENTECSYPFNATLFVEKFADYCAGVFSEVSYTTFNENHECNSLQNC